MASQRVPPEERAVKFALKNEGRCWKMLRWTALRGGCGGAVLGSFLLGFGPSPSSVGLPGCTPERRLGHLGGTEEGL